MKEADIKKAANEIFKAKIIDVEVLSFMHDAAIEKIKELASCKEKAIPFQIFWDEYDKKVGDSIKIQKKWVSLSNKNQAEIMDYLPEYKKAQPNKAYRKNPSTFLNQKGWKDELIYSQSNVAQQRSNERSLVKSNAESRLREQVINAQRDRSDPAGSSCND